jgi:hypothetical protein
MVLLREITKTFNWGTVVSSIHRRRGDLGAAVETLEEYAAEGIDMWADFMVEVGLVASDVGRHNIAAPLLAFGIAEMTRDGSSFPPTRQVEWDAAWAAISEHIEGPEAVESEWSEKTVDEVVPVALETLAELRHALESAER